VGRNPNTLVHILGALHPRSGVPIRQLLRKLQSSPEFKSQGARINNKNNDSKHAYACTQNNFTHLRVLLVLTDRGILVLTEGTSRVN
jgi:hypothetical protein